MRYAAEAEDIQQKLGRHLDAAACKTYELNGESEAYYIRPPRPLLAQEMIRKKLDYDRSEYLNHYLLTYMQGVELRAGSELVYLLKSGEPRVTKLP